MSSTLKNMSNDEDKSEYITINIPQNLAKKIKERMRGTGFSSLSTCNATILTNLKSSFEKEESNEQVFTKGEEEKVKQRLRTLGYIKINCSKDIFLK